MILKPETCINPAKVGSVFKKKIYKHTRQHKIKIISCQHKGNGTVSNRAERERERVREGEKEREGGRERRRDVVLDG